MAKDDESKSAGKKKRQAARTGEGREKSGAAHDGSRKPGVDRGKDENTAPYRKGGKGGQH